MKRTKKFASLLLALVMVLSMAFTASAAVHSVTINPADGDTATHTYGAYQIFAGSTTNDPKVENITFGSAITGKENEFITTLQGISGTTAFDDLSETSTAAQVAGAISAYTTVHDSAEAKTLAATIGAFIKAQGITASETAAQTFDSLEEGYYFFKDEANPDDGEATDDAYGASTRFILDVVGDMTVTAKASVPQVEKKVDDKVDSSNGEDSTSWADDADYDIGDIVPYKIVGTVSSTIGDYTKYSYKFVDTMTDGLEYFTDNDTYVTKVYMFDTKDAADAAGAATDANGTDVTEHFTITGSGQNLTVEAKDTNGLKDIEGVTGTSAFVVYYYAKVTSNAVMGSAGNPNDVYLEFSNNPNAGGEGETGTTPKDTAIVFTYNVVVNKTEKDTNSTEENATKPLTGADFMLYKKYTIENANAEGKTAATMPTAGIKEEQWDLEDGYIWVEVKGPVKSAKDGIADSVFTFNHIDDGEYMIVETVTPAGYNSIDPQKFTVSAKHENEELTELSGTPATGAVITLTGTLNTGALSTDVLNNSGTQLPSTGGMGTTIFYIVGSVLLVGAAILLITKKRMSAEN